MQYISRRNTFQFISSSFSILFWKLCWLLWGKICPRLIWGFSEVTEVDKREPRESFSKPRPHFWGRGRRPRPRNEQAEAEKCSLRFPFVYWGNLGNSNWRSKMFPSIRKVGKLMLITLSKIMRSFWKACRLSEHCSNNGITFNGLVNKLVSHVPWRTQWLHSGNCLGHPQNSTGM